MRISQNHLSLAVAAIAVLGLAGCSQKDDTPPPTTVVNTPAPAPTVVTTPPGPTTTTVVPGPTVPPTNNTNAGVGGATGDNAALADAVNKKIRTNTQMTGSRVTAVAEADGTIRLTGTAQNAQQKALAESSAHNTTGVLHVINKVEIVPTGGVKATQAPPPTKTITKTKVIVVKSPPASSNTTGGSADTSGNGSSSTTSSSGTGSTDGAGSTGGTTPNPPTPPTNGTGQ